VYQVLRLPVNPLPRTSVGFLNIPHDPDGFVRRVPLYLDFRTVGRIESFAGRLAGLAARERPPARPSGREMFINLRGPAGTIPAVPFHQVVRGAVGPQAFAGKIVLIGATSPVLHDVFHTPFTPRDPMPGVEIQANALDNLLGADPLRPAGASVALLLAVLAAAAGTRLGSRIPPPRSFLAVAVIGCAVVVTAHLALVWYRLWIEQFPIHLALFGTYFAMLISAAPFRNPFSSRSSTGLGE
jgi:CHASE2 domain-containing sensor protein